MGTEFGLTPSALFLQIPQHSRGIGNTVLGFYVHFYIRDDYSTKYQIRTYNNILEVPERDRCEEMRREMVDIKFSAFNPKFPPSSTTSNHQVKEQQKHPRPFHDGAGLFTTNKPEPFDLVNNTRSTHPHRQPHSSSASQVDNRPHPSSSLHSRSPVQPPHLHPPGAPQHH